MPPAKPRYRLRAKNQPDPQFRMLADDVDKVFLQIGRDLARLESELDHGLVGIVNMFSHAPRHISGGADEVDGDQLDIDWNPTNYSPTTIPAEVTSIEHLGAHLAGIDSYIGGLSGLIPPGTVLNSTLRWSGSAWVENTSFHTLGPTATIGTDASPATNFNIRKSETAAAQISWFSNGFERYRDSITTSELRQLVVYDSAGVLVGVPMQVTAAADVRLGVTAGVLEMWTDIEAHAPNAHSIGTLADPFLEIITRNQTLGDFVVAPTVEHRKPNGGSTEVYYLNVDAVHSLGDFRELHDSNEFWGLQYHDGASWQAVYFVDPTGPDIHFAVDATFLGSITLGGVVLGVVPQGTVQGSMLYWDTAGTEWLEETGIRRTDAQELTIGDQLGGPSLIFDKAAAVDATIFDVLDVGVRRWRGFVAGLDESLQIARHDNLGVGQGIPLNLQPDGDVFIGEGVGVLNLNAAWEINGAGTLYPNPAGSQIGSTSFRVSALFLNSYIDTAEQAAPGVPAAGAGRWWVRNDTPNVPMFTDDGGVAHVLAYSTGGAVSIAPGTQVGAINYWSGSAWVEETTIRREAADTFRIGVTSGTIRLGDNSDTVTYSSGAIRLQRPGANVFFDGDEWSPSIAGIDLGRIGTRWDNVFGVTGDFSGNVTAGGYLRSNAAVGTSLNLAGDSPSAFFGSGLNTGSPQLFERKGAGVGGYHYMMVGTTTDADGNFRWLHTSAETFGLQSFFNLAWNDVWSVAGAGDTVTFHGDVVIGGVTQTAGLADGTLDGAVPVWDTTTSAWIQSPVDSMRLFDSGNVSIGAPGQTLTINAPTLNMLHVDPVLNFGNNLGTVTTQYNKDNPDEVIFDYHTFFSTASGRRWRQRFDTSSDWRLDRWLSGASQGSVIHAESADPGHLWIGDADAAAETRVRSRLYVTDTAPSSAGAQFGVASTTGSVSFAQGSVSYGAKPPGYSDVFAGVVSNTALDVVSWSLSVQDGARNSRAEFFMADAAIAADRTWGLWHGWSSGGNGPFLVGSGSAEWQRFDTGGDAYFPAHRLAVNTDTYTANGLIEAVGHSGMVIASDSDTDLTNKLMRLGVLHRTIAEEPFFGMVLEANSGSNIARIGGGSGLGNAATQASVHLAATTTVTSGTEEWRWTPGELTSAAGVRLGVGIGLGAANFEVVGSAIEHVSSNGMVVGGSSAADNTNKHARMAVYHYDIDEEPMAVWWASCLGLGSTDGTIRIGGGDASMNSPTSIAFVVEDDTITTFGTPKWSIVGGSSNVLQPENGNWDIATASNRVGALHLLDYVDIEESASIAAPAAGDGRVGVLNETPNVLGFVDDAGNVHPLSLMPEISWSADGFDQSGGVLIVPDAETAASLTLFSNRVVAQFSSGVRRASAKTTSIPASYSGNGLEVDITWASSSNTGGTVEFEVSVENHNPGESNTTDSFDTAVTSSATSPGTSATYTRRVVSLADADLDGAGPGDVIRIAIVRDGVNDTHTGTVRIDHVRVYEANTMADAA